MNIKSNKEQLLGNILDEYLLINHMEIIRELISKNINLKFKYSNKHLFLSQFFYFNFKIFPKYVFISDFGTIFFIPPSQYKKSRFRRNFQTFRKKFNTRVFLFPYPNNLIELIKIMFSHVNILDIKVELIDEIFLNKHYKRRVEIYLFLDDKEIPRALGKEGYYIHLVNDLMKQIGDFSIFLRS